MIVDGTVRMWIELDVVDLETNSCEFDRMGNVIVTSPEQFFSAWVDDWVIGRGTLLGCDVIWSDMNCVDEEE